MVQSTAGAGRDSDGWSPLDRAAGSGDVQAVRELLAAGADPREAGPDGQTPYDIALAAAHLEAARVLRLAEDAADGSVPRERGWRPYCRAYRLGELRAFPDWPAAPAGGADRDDDSIVYLHDDLTVTGSAWPGEDVLLDAGSEDWQRFCRETLGFAVPDDFDLAMPTSGGHRDHE